MPQIENLTLIFGPFEPVHLHKDVGMIPAYLAKAYGLQCRIVSLRSRANCALPDAFLGVRIVRIADCFKFVFCLSALRALRDIPLAAYLALHARRIRVLMLYHVSASTVVSIAVYKFFNRNGFVYIKADMDRITLNEYEKVEKRSMRTIPAAPGRRSFAEKAGSVIARFRLWFLKWALTRTDLISVEAGEVFDRMRRSFLGADMRGKIIALPNGMDDDGARASGVKVLPFDEKEDLIITVGRIGTFQKNTRQLLGAIEKIDLGPWRVSFIGPMAPGFEREVNAFYARSPHLSKKVTFVGPVEDRAELYRWYNRAKIFCLTSRYESWSLVCAEALYFGDFIIATDVTGAVDITKGGALGTVIPVDSVDALASELEAVISGKKEIRALHESIIAYSRANFLWSALTKKLYHGMSARFGRAMSGEGADA